MPTQSNELNININIVQNRVEYYRRLRDFYHGIGTNPIPKSPLVSNKCNQCILSGLIAYRNFQWPKYAEKRDFKRSLFSVQIPPSWLYYYVLKLSTRHHSESLWYNILEMKLRNITDCNLQPSVVLLQYWPFAHFLGCILPQWERSTTSIKGPVPWRSVGFPFPPKVGWFLAAFPPFVCISPWLLFQNNLKNLK